MVRMVGWVCLEWASVLGVGKCDWSTSVIEV